MAARVNLPNTSNVLTPKKKRGRPPLSNEAKKPRTVNMCNLCFTELGRGKPHKCTKIQKHENMLNILKDNAADVGDSVVSSYVKEKQPNENGYVTLKNLRGLPSLWTKNSEAPKKHVITVDDLFLIKKNCNLSTRNTITLSSTLRALDITVAPNVNKGLTQLNNRLEEYFQVTHLPFDINGEDKKQPKIILKPVVYCNNVPKLVEFICNERKIGEKDFFLKIGIDGGGGFLKITLSMVENEINGRCKAGEKNFKSTGVKKLLLLAVIPGIPEKYSNISQIWITLLELNKLEAVVSGDLKIINLLLGIMGHSSSYPCPYCFTPRNCLSEKAGSSRTLTNIQQNAENWKNSGANEKHARNFFNCIKEPLLCGTSSDEIIELCPPPVLHITLGIINAIYKSVESIDSEVAELWVTRSNSTRHSKYGFTGRNCHKLIEHRSILSTDGPLGTLRKV